MFSNSYIYIYIKFILKRRFFPSGQFLCCIQRNPSPLISKQLGRKYSSMEQLPIDRYLLLYKQMNSISVNQYILSL